MKCKAPHIILGTYLKSWHQARSNKSVENVCGAVAKTGDAKGCKYGTSCRFNHDLVAYLQQVRMPDIQALLTLELELRT